MPLMVSSILNADGIGIGFPPYSNSYSDGNNSLKPVNKTNDANNSQNKDEYLPGAQNSAQSNDKKVNYNAFGKNSAVNTTNKNNGNQQQPTGVKALSPDEQKLVEELQKRDTEVRAHENAHKTVGDGLVRGGASFTYTTGPDGKQYATGGEVQIDISPVNGDPEATIQKMEKVRAAALAPVDPSAQDRSVAALAASIAANARMEELNQNNQTGTVKPKTPTFAIAAYKKSEQTSTGVSSRQSDSNQNGLGISSASLNIFV